MVLACEARAAAVAKARRRGHRSKRRPLFNLVLLRELDRQPPGRTAALTPLPDSFNNLKSLYKQQCGLVLLESVHIARCALRSASRNGFALQAQPSRDATKQSTTSTFRVCGRLSKVHLESLRPSSLFRLVSGPRATEERGVLAMVQSYDAASACAVFDVLDSNYASELRHAVPLARLMSQRRMFSCCVRRPSPAFSSQLLGIPAAKHTLFVSDDDDEETGVSEPSPSPKKRQRRRPHGDESGLNASQVAAIERFLDEHTPALQLLQGPPGTGKTRTVVRLLHHLLGLEDDVEAERPQRKRVVVCAPSNKAVRLVLNELLISLPAELPDPPLVVLVGVDDDNMTAGARSVFIHDGGRHLVEHAAAAVACMRRACGVLDGNVLDSVPSQKLASIEEAGRELRALKRLAETRSPRCFERNGCGPALRDAIRCVGGTVRVHCSRERDRTRSRSLTSLDGELPEGKSVFDVVSALQSPSESESSMEVIDISDNEDGEEEEDEDGDDCAEELAVAHKQQQQEEWERERGEACEAAALRSCVALLAKVESLASNSRTELEQEWCDNADALFCTLCCAGRKAVRGRRTGCDALIIDEAAQAVRLKLRRSSRCSAVRLACCSLETQASSAPQCRAVRRLGFRRSLMQRLMDANNTHFATAPSDPHGAEAGSTSGLASPNRIFVVRGGGGAPFGLLDTQYRMHPEISRFPLSHFYGGRVSNASCVFAMAPPWCAKPSSAVSPGQSFIGTPDLGTGKIHNLSPPPFFILDVSDGCERATLPNGSFANESEAALVPRLLHWIQQRSRDEARKSANPIAGLSTTVQCITFYSGQVAAVTREVVRYANELRSKAGHQQQDTIASGERADRNLIAAEIGACRPSTVDSFQGSETEVVLLSCVRSNTRSSVGFVSEFRRLNVALTRAKRGLIVIANVATFRACPSPDLRALFADAEARGLVTTPEVLLQGAYGTSGPSRRTYNGAPSSGSREPSSRAVIKGKRTKDRNRNVIGTNSRYIMKRKRANKKGKEEKVVLC